MNLGRKRIERAGGLADRERMRRRLCISGGSGLSGNWLRASPRGVFRAFRSEPVWIEAGKPFTSNLFLVDLVGVRRALDAICDRRRARLVGETHERSGFSG